MKKGDRQYYEQLFSKQPDVLDTETVRKLLGCISMETVWKLIRDEKLKHIYYHNRRFLIPKVWLIDYILSDHYQGYKEKPKRQISGKAQIAMTISKILASMEDKV